MSTTFADLGVPQQICDALADRGIHEPFEIQAATIGKHSPGYAITLGNLALAVQAQISIFL